ncbi:cyclodeaminase/cyclohydrolase family protein [Deinococcus gobiensis]|uniref:cyclodeaminase/cyclohydrolase family protein n=2 Tax=Deinococcus TaxID=1298 RepID=UPI0002FC9741|nr:cyclodeaminase/cyclohydrolase family protein [Deinococcus gobiensis]
MTLPDTLWTHTAQDLLSATSSRQPTPGGGSVAALSGAFGAGLVLMAARISLHKAQKAGQVPDLALTAALDTLEEVQGHLRRLTDEDVAVFRGYVDATRLPRTTEEEQAARRAALDRAGEAARAAPLETAQACVEALEQAQACLPHTHPEVVSDVGAGAALLRGALEAALLTLDINLRHLEGEERARLQARRTGWSARGETLAAGILEDTRAAISRGA